MYKNENATMSNYLESLNRPLMPKEQIEDAEMDWAEFRYRTGPYKSAAL